MCQVTSREEAYFVTDGKAHKVAHGIQGVFGPDCEHGGNMLKVCMG